MVLSFLQCFTLLKKYKVTWILKWLYVKEGNVLTRQWFVKLWNKFSLTQDVIDNATEEFLVVNTITHNKAQASAYPLVQTAATTPATTFTVKPAKPSAKIKKKKSSFDDLSKSALIALQK